MSNQSIDNALITEFSAQVHVEAQQIQARTRKYVRTGPKSGDIWSYDGIGSVDAMEVVGRNKPVVFSDIDHNRRKIARRRFMIALPIDAKDVRGMLLNPEANYARLVRMGMERVFDRVVFEAAFADVKIGRDFEDTLTFAADGGLTVDATAALSYEKLLEINQNYTDNEVGIDMPVKRLLTLTGDEETALMGEIELISGDFSRSMVVDQGEIVKGAGNDFIKYGANAKRPMFPVVSSERALVSMAENGIFVGISKDIMIEVQDRNDLVETKQVVAIFELGAVRTEGKLVQKVRTTAT